MAVYFFYGDEDYNIEQAIENLKSGLDKNFLSVNYKTLNNPTFPDLIEALRSQGIMFGKMLTVINCNNLFEKTLEDNQLKELETSLANVLENSDVVFVIKLPRNENKKIDTRKKIFKILSKHNTQEFPTFKLNYYGKQDLSAWIKKNAKAKNISIEQDICDMLIEQIGNNLRELDTELEKLKLIAYPQKNITQNMVKEICISNEDVFQFTELVMTQNFDKALIEYKKLLDKKHPLEILSTTQTILRQRILYKIHSNKSIEEIASITGMSEKQIKAISKSAKNLNLKKLVKLKENLTLAEYKIKSGQSINDEIEVQNAILR